MIRFFKGFRLKDWLLTGISIILIVIEVWMDLNLPAYMSKITVLLQKPGTSMNDILMAGGKMLGFALCSMAATCITAVIVAALSYSIGGSLRSRLFHQVMSFSMTESEKFSPASLITRSTNDITQVQGLLVVGLQVIVKAPLTAVGAITKISGMVWQWTAITVGGTILIILFVSICVALILPKQKKAQQMTDELNKAADANLTGIAVIHAYNAEKTAEKKFSDTNESMTYNNLFAARAMAFLSPSVNLILNLMTIAIYWVGALVISHAGSSLQAQLFANMLAFAQYATQIVNAFVMLTMIFTMIPRAMVSFNRISEVIETKPSITDASDPQSASETGTVAFDHVSFCYPGTHEPVIKDISFSASKGQTVALIGSTGSGKTTVVDMIPRFYDTSEGTVSVDGVDVKDYRLKDLRDKIGFCFQQPALLSGDIRSNVCYGGESSQKNLEKAMETSQADEFVSKDPNGLDASVMQDGANFSGGQKQRLTLARALNKNPEILILDDSTSALDYSTERKLKADLEKNYPDTTKIVITQRIGSIINADQIIVLDDGKIVGQGTHDELLKDCKVYQQIAKTQKEEAAL